MAKKKDYSKKVPGQQFPEIEDAQRHWRQRQRQGEGGIDSTGERGRIIDSIEKSKQRDKEELKQLGDEALDNLRKRKSTPDQDK